METRKYNNYKEYIEHQKSKLLQPGYLDKRIRKFNYRISRFLEKFEVLIDYYSSSPGFFHVLCLAARLGEEVMAWKLLTPHSIGIDIMPPSSEIQKKLANNILVIHGDFHNIPFKNNSQDVIYSNSLDHSLYVKKFSDELKRVLNKNNPKSIVFLEVKPHKKSDIKSMYNWEVFHWENEKELVEFFDKEKWNVKYIEIQTTNRATSKLISVPYLILRP